MRAKKKLMSRKKQEKRALALGRNLGNTDLVMNNSMLSTFISDKENSSSNYTDKQVLFANFIGFISLVFD